MKIVTLIQDGHGRLHLLATCAPDLARRQYSAATGHAELLWCGVVPNEIGAKVVVAELAGRFHQDPVDGLKARPGEIIRALHHETVTRPCIRRLTRPLKHVWRRIRHRVRAMTSPSPVQTAV